jgi:N-acetyl sugar amidotransferase
MKVTCSRCILDTVDDPKISFDEEGICNHCKIYEENIQKYYHGNDPELKMFQNLVKEVKRKGERSKYDVIIGLSGGVDSTYVAYLCWKFNIRALAVHLDNGWNSELSVVNIKNILKITGFDLYTYVINWEEFRDLQRSYIKAQVIDIEVLTDHAISTILLKVAAENNIQYILNGNSITTEGRLPEHWIHNKSDSINIRDIHKKFGKIQLKTFPLKSIWSTLLFPSKVQSISILDLYPYNKPLAKELIIREFCWRDYGGKHYESVFTRFYQAYILPRKFGVDKRKSHYSALICANQLTRNEALELMKEQTYSDSQTEKSDYDFVLKKLGFSNEEFEQYIKRMPIDHNQYKSIMNFYNALRPIYRFLKYRVLRFS